QPQPGQAYLFRNLLSLAFHLDCGLVRQSHRLLFPGAAVTTGKERHRELDADHPVRARVAGRAKIATAAQSIATYLADEIDGGGRTPAILRGLLPRDIGRQQAGENSQVASLRLLQPELQRLER